MSSDKLAQALRDLLAKVRRDAPELSGKLMGYCDAVLAEHEAEKQAGPVAIQAAAPAHYGRAQQAIEEGQRMAAEAAFPVVSRWTMGAKDAGPRARVWVQFEDSGAEVEFAPAAQSPAQNTATPSESAQVELAGPVATQAPAAAHAAQAEPDEATAFEAAWKTHFQTAYYGQPKTINKADAFALWKFRSAVQSSAVGAAQPEWRKAVQEAYGWLWHINNEPLAPVPLLSEGKAAYQARKALRELLTSVERGEAINAVTAAIDNMKAAPPSPLAEQDKEDAERWRADFEQYAQNCPMGRFDVTRKGDGYWSSHTQIMWDTWCTARAKKEPQ